MGGQEWAGYGALCRPADAQARDGPSPLRAQFVRAQTPALRGAWAGGAESGPTQLQPGATRPPTTTVTCVVLPGGADSSGLPDPPGPPEPPADAGTPESRTPPVGAARRPAAHSRASNRRRRASGILPAFRRRRPLGRPDGALRGTIATPEPRRAFDHRTAPAAERMTLPAQRGRRIRSHRSVEHLDLMGEPADAARHHQLVSTRADHRRRRRFDGGGGGAVVVFAAATRKRPTSSVAAGAGVVTSSVGSATTARTPARTRADCGTPVVRESSISAARSPGGQRNEIRALGMYDNVIQASDGLEPNREEPSMGERTDFRVGDLQSQVGAPAAPAPAAFDGATRPATTA